MAERLIAIPCKGIMFTHSWVQISLALLTTSSRISIFNELKKHYGINNKKALNIIIYLGLAPNTLYKSIPKNKLITLFKVLNYLKDEASIDASLKNKIKTNINEKIKINSFAGKRHRLGYPVKGQRTRSNARTAKKLNRFRFI